MVARFWPKQLEKNVRGVCWSHLSLSVYNNMEFKGVAQMGELNLGGITYR